MHKIIIIQNELLHDNKDRNIDICTLKEFVIVNARGKQLITISLCSMIFYRDEIISTKEFTLEFYVFLWIVKKLIKQHVHGMLRLYNKTSFNYLPFYHCQ